MLPHKRRLTRDLFQRLRVSRLTVQNKSASLRFSPSALPGRFSVVIPKSLYPHATDRNRLRRVFYSALKEVCVPIQGIFYLKQKKDDFRVVLDAVQELTSQATKSRGLSLKDL